MDDHPCGYTRELKKKRKKNSNFSQLFHEIMTISQLFHEIVTIFTFIHVPYPLTSREEFQSYQRKNTQIAVMDPEHFKTLCYNLQKYFEYNSRVKVSNHLHQHEEFKTQTLKFFYSEKIFNSPWTTLSIFLSLAPQEKAILGMKNIRQMYHKHSSIIYARFFQISGLM